ncbi:unnamed protein product [Amoebophrya sp. A25]|nr:unnamed protein product [Amoebophrya sp. A25]|eukprot:GSA25T00012547001.1
MGLAYSRIFERIGDAKIVVTGPPHVGKKTLFSRLNVGESEALFEEPRSQDVARGFAIRHTVGRPMYSFDLDRRSWAKYAPEMRKHYGDADGIIFLVDSTSDREDLMDTRDLLHRLLKDPLVADSVILVLANKQDVPGALSVSSLTRALSLEAFNQMIWRVVPTSCVNEEGVYEGLDWLSRTLVKKAEIAQMPLGG